MNPLSVLAAVLLALGLGAVAKAQVGLPFPGPGGKAGAATYTGPGDAATYTFWMSTARAYSTATRGTNAVQLCQPANTNCVNITSDATTGLVPNAPTVNGSACDNGAHQCFIKTMYDQTGNGFFQDQTTGANQPKWHVSATGSFPCGGYVRASSLNLGTNAGPTTITQPFLVQAVARRSSGQSANQNDIISALTSQVELYHGNSASNVSMYSGNGANVLSVALTDNTFGSIAGIFNGASSSINVNSTMGSGVSLGTNTSTDGHFRIGAFETGPSNFYDGDICEVGIANAVSSTTTRDNLMSNAKTFYEF